jgi:hypothetical protein
LWSIEAIIMSQCVGWGVMTSEKEDTFIADLAVGFSMGKIKINAPYRYQRLAKYILDASTRDDRHKVTIHEGAEMSCVCEIRG